MNICEVIDNTNSSIESESRMEYDRICKEIDNCSTIQLNNVNNAKK